MILVVGPNPAIDRTAVVDRLSFDTVLRPREVRVQAGGKALNVARAACALGALVATSGICGGHAGRWLLESARAEGLSPRFVETGPETRTTYVVIDDHGRSVLVYEPSAPTAPDAFEALLTLVEGDLLPSAERVVLAGSLPSGVPSDGFARLVDLCLRAGRPVLLDTSGPALTAGLAARPDIAKVSLEEAVEAGVVERRATALEAVRALVEAGAASAVVTDGPRGAAAMAGGMTWHVGAARVDAVDPIGSGDAFSAGLVVALAVGRPMEEALAWGAAAGAANALCIGAGNLDVAAHEQLVAGIRVERR